MCFPSYTEDSSIIRDPISGCTVDTIVMENYEVIIEVMEPRGLFTEQRKRNGKKASVNF